MFRDVHWVAEDFSMRAQLGFAIFRWWRSLTNKKITEGGSMLPSILSLNFHCACLLVVINHADDT